MTTRTVMPGGGGDFTTLAAGVAGSSASDTLVCYAGDVGPANVNKALTIVSHTSARCNPLLEQGTSGLSYITGGSVEISASGVVIEGMLFSAGALFCSDGAALTSLVVRKCRFAGGVGVGITITSTDVDKTGIVFDNCVVVCVENELAFYLVPAGASTNATMTVAIRNCTLIAPDADAQSAVYTGAFAFPGFSATLNITATNVGAFGFTVLGDFYELLTGGGGTEDVVWDQDYCASSDGTANDWGGSGHLLNQVAADWFENVDTDLRLKVGSNGIDAGTTIGAVTDDAIGTARPQGSAYDIGAHELVQAAALVPMLSLLGVGA